MTAAGVRESRPPPRPLPPCPSGEPPALGCLLAPQPFALTFEKCQAEPGDGSCGVAPGQLVRFGWVSVCFLWRTPLAGMKGEGRALALGLWVWGAAVGAAGGTWHPWAAW